MFFPFIKLRQSLTWLKRKRNNQQLFWPFYFLLFSHDSDWNISGFSFETLEFHFLYLWWSFFTVFRHISQNHWLNWLIEQTSDSLIDLQSSITVAELELIKIFATHLQQVNICKTGSATVSTNMATLQLFRDKDSNELLLGKNPKVVYIVMKLFNP